MISQSDTAPATIRVDLIQGNMARVQVRYNIKETPKVSEDGKISKDVSYQYDEKVMWIEVPKGTPTTKEAVLSTIDKESQLLIDRAKLEKDIVVERPTQPPYPPLTGRF